MAALSLALAGAPLVAQSTDVAPARGLDSTPAAASDSTLGATARGDTIRGDTARGDTIAPAGGDGGAPPPRPARPPAPVDSVLGRACEESGGGSPDLLLITFRPSTTASERAAVAREVDGALVGPSDAAPGAWYLRAPGAAIDRSVADRVIVLSPVLEVGNTRCPARSPTRP